MFVPGLHTFNTVVEFLEAVDESFHRKILEIKHDVAYLADTFRKFNELNLQLQGDDLNLIKAKSAIFAFIAKISILRRSLGHMDFSYFPSLGQVGNAPDDDTLLVYSEHLENLEKKMKERFQDLDDLTVPAWVLNPFDSDKCDPSCEEELITLRNDFELKPTFRARNYQEFWLQEQVQEKFPILWEKVKVLFIGFPSSYLVERGFSAVILLLTKARNRLDIVDRGDLRLRLTNLQPDIQGLAASHQIHPSHGSSSSITATYTYILNLFY